MAGLGSKVFIAGDVLTAADVNGYLMEQSVAVFATTGARTTAIPSPSTGMCSYITGTNSFEIYTGGAWVSVSGAGTWTTYSPVITPATGAFGALTYSTQNGGYRLNGKTVHFRINLVVGTVTVGTASGTLRISLPLTAAAVGNQVATGWYSNNTTGNRYRISWLIPSSAAVVQTGLYVDGTTTGQLQVTLPSTIASGDQFVVSGTYEIA